MHWSGQMDLSWCGMLGVKSCISLRIGQKDPHPPRALYTPAPL